MTKKEKIEEKIRANTRNVFIEDFEALIRQYGYIKQGTKHPLACIGKRIFPYKRTNPLNREYVDKILEIIDAQK